MTTVQENFKNIQVILEQALVYDEKGDAYNAAKLYKKVVKLAPYWSVPYHFLSRFYRKRQEWKPSFHYSKKAIEYNPQDKSAWQILATSATVLKRWAVARDAWNKLGHDFRIVDKALNLDLGLIPICIHSKTKPEIIWAKQIGPARAQIYSIPQPASGRRYKEIILFENQAIAHRVVQGQRIPVYEELEKAHLSIYKTFAVILETTSMHDVDILDSLCLNAGIGFDNWSKASRQFWKRNKNEFPEFYGRDLFFEKQSDFNNQLIALASPDEESVKKVLANWKIITLQSFRNLVTIKSI